MGQSVNSCTYNGAVTHENHDELTPINYKRARKSEREHDRLYCPSCNETFGGIVHRTNCDWCGR